MIAIFGPTASGKSDLALRLADAEHGEIVACDAIMVYRGFDLVANKPRAAERARLPHHLLDVCDWDAPMNAADYARLAGDAIADIEARGRTAVVVVGTFLYYRALQYGLGALPPADAVLRAKLLAREAQEPGFIAAEVRREDPDAFAEAGHGKNAHRLLRALEVYRLTGRAASALKREHGFQTARYPQTRRIGLLPPREALDRRVRRRVEAMIAAGALDEVRRLRAKGVPADARPMCAVGYRQLNALLDRGQDRVGDDTIEAIAIATRQYARRQMTFFKHEPDVEWRESFG